MFPLLVARLRVRPGTVVKAKAEALAGAMLTAQFPATDQSPAFPT